MTTVSAPQRLYLMQVGSIPERNLPFVCYLIQTGDGANILVDTGLPDNITPPGLPAPTLTKNVIEQLAIIGLQPGDISQLICTHFDGDHSGHHEAFTQAEFVIQRAHYEHAKTEQRFAINRAQWDQPSIRYCFVEGDTELRPGLQLLSTDGHTPGHQSVLVRLPETGPVLLTIDAVPTQAAFTMDRELGRADHDFEAVKAGTRKLLDLVEREHISTVIFGHDGDQWKTLEKLPDYYS